MILFFQSKNGVVTAVDTAKELSLENINSLVWLFSDATLVSEGDKPVANMDGIYVGPRREMITPWSTTAVEITQNMNTQNVDKNNIPILICSTLLVLKAKPVTPYSTIERTNHKSTNNHAAV